MIGFERSGIVVHLVVQLLYSGFYFKAIAFADALPVDDLGNRAQGNACFPSNVAHGCGGFLCMVQGNTSLFRRKMILL